MKTTIITLIFTVYFNFTFSQTESSYKLTEDEIKLCKLINDYRKSNNLKPIKISPSLTKVAKIHVDDLINNQPVKGNCNMHSWSDKGTWKPCCYTDDHKNAALMWSKPSELTDYKSNGYEIAYFFTNGATPEDALAGWKSSYGHKNVILERGVFSKSHWKAMGVSIKGIYAVAWFGEELDTLPETK